MSLGEIVAIALAGLAAGAINTLVGSGTLITFPVLLAFGYAPVTANVSNTIGLVPGSVSGAVGYRRELLGQRQRAVRLGTVSALGGAYRRGPAAAAPASAFKAIVPVFIAIALVLTVLQPRLARWLLKREIDLDRSGMRADAGGCLPDRRLRRLLRRGPGNPAARLSSAWRWRRTCSAPTRSRTCSSGSSTAWQACTSRSPRTSSGGPAAIIAGASILGAQLGARYGRRLPPDALRAVIVVVGVSAIVRLLAD